MVAKNTIGKAMLATMIAMTLSAGVAHAGEKDPSGKNKFTKEERNGLLTGAAAGALVGGPIGAAVGAMFGGILGDSIGSAKRADLKAQSLEDKTQSLEDELMQTRLALAKASERSGGDEMLDALAERLHADVLFRTNGTDVDAQVAQQLESIGTLLAQHDGLEVELHGFADPRGKSKENLELSQRRAEVVREALIKGGASPERVIVAAHGEGLSTANKDDLEAYAWERRVSVAIRPTTTTSVARASE
jgi:outer membrane protein OmpA-like peptidoglycan-associated protein